MKLKKKKCLIHHFKVCIRKYCGSVSQRRELPEARKKIEHFHAQRRSTAAVPVWWLLCVLLPEQKGNSCVLFPHFIVVHCQCGGWMVIVLLCWFRSFPSPFLMHSCRGLDILICCWMGFQRSPWPRVTQAWNRWQNWGLNTYKFKNTNKHKTHIFHERLTCQITAVTCVLPTRAASHQHVK